MVPQGLDLELATMQNIATALARLDPAARARTLVWLCQRFELETAPAQAAVASAAASTTVSPLRIVSAPVAAFDETLSIETLGEMFDRCEAKPKAETTPQSVTGLLSELVADFQGLARDWNDVCGTPGETVPAPRLLSAAS